MNPSHHYGNMNTLSIDLYKHDVLMYVIVLSILSVLSVIIPDAVILTYDKHRLTLITSMNVSVKPRHQNIQEPAHNGPQLEG